jgi:hypothetical protein
MAVLQISDQHMVGVRGRVGHATHSEVLKHSHLVVAVVVVVVVKVVLELVVAQ